MASNSGWSKGLPSATSSVALGDDDIRSNNSVLQAGLQDEHYWTDGSANSAGVHKTGSARAFSQSAAPTATLPIGQLWHDSDIDALFVAEAAGTGSWTQVSSSNNILSASTLWDPGATMAAGDLSTLTVAVTSAVVEDTVVVSNPYLKDGLYNNMTGYVDSAGVVMIVYVNNALSGNALPSARTVKIRVIQ